jgi:putative CocE/NonD family hydrolase
VKQDCRGRFDSEGRFDPLREDTDGYDTIAWIRAQPWCDGRIGMLGGSYNGLTQLTAAWTRPAGLLAITPAVMGRDLFKDLVYYNGVPGLAIAVGWGLAVAGRSAQTNDTTDWDKVFRHLPLNSMDEAAGYRLGYLREWLAHPTYDDHWAAVSVERHYADFDVPALHSSGWYDFYADGVVRNFCGIRAKGGARARPNQKLIMGPWGHGRGTRAAGQLDFGEQAALGMEEIEARWLDRWVKGEQNGIDREPPVQIFVMGENVWRDETAWPPERAVETALFLDSNGAANSLYGNGVLRREQPAGAESDSYVCNPDNPVPTLGGCAYRPVNGPTDHTPVERRDDVLVYSTEPLERPVEVTGFVRMVLYASSDAPDTDFVARLCDVYPDGRSIVTCDGIVRARFREGLDREVFMKPGTVYEFPIEMGVTSNAFLPGHRIRLEVTSSCFPRFARNLNTDEPVATGTRRRLARQTVRHSPAYPSRLILPVVPR